MEKGNTYVGQAQPTPNLGPCRGDAAQKLRIALELVLEPVLFRLKAYQDPSRATVARNDDLLLFWQRR